MQSLERNAKEEIAAALRTIYVLFTQSFPITMPDLKMA